MIKSILTNKNVQQFRTCSEPVYRPVVCSWVGAVACRGPVSSPAAEARWRTVAHRQPSPSPWFPSTTRPPSHHKFTAFVNRAIVDSRLHPSVQRRLVEERRLTVNHLHHHGSQLLHMHVSFIRHLKKYADCIITKYALKICGSHWVMYSMEWA